MLDSLNLKDKTIKLKKYSKDNKDCIAQEMHNNIKTSICPADSNEITIEGQF